MEQSSNSPTNEHLLYSHVSEALTELAQSNRALDISIRELSLKFERMTAGVEPLLAARVLERLAILEANSVNDEKRGVDYARVISMGLSIVTFLLVLFEKMIKK